jgi:hypothetical protein
MARVLVKSIAVPAYNEAAQTWTLGGTSGVLASHTIQAQTTGDYALKVLNTDTTNGASGLRVSAGNGASSSSFTVSNYNNTINFFTVDGSGAIVFGPPGSATSPQYSFRVGASNSFTIATGQIRIGNAHASGAQPIIASSTTDASKIGLYILAANTDAGGGIADMVLDARQSVGSQGSDFTTLTPIAFAFTRFNSTTLGSIQRNGNFTFGTASIVSDTFHIVRGNCGIAFTNLSGAVGIGSNFNEGTTRNFNRLTTTTNGAYLGFDANTTAAQAALSFHVQPPGGSVGGTTGAIQAGYINGLGEWNFGTANEVVNVTHIFNGPRGNVSGDYKHTILRVQGAAGQNSLAVLAAGSNAVSYTALIMDRSTVDSYLWFSQSNTNRFRFVTTTGDSWFTSGAGLTGQAGYAEYGSIAKLGGWTLGPTTGTNDVQHNFYTYTGSGTASNTFNERNAANDFAARILHARSSGSYLAFRFFDGASDNCGDISVNTTANTTAYNTSSDSRLKHMPENFDGLSIVMQMLPKKYERISDPGVKEFGLYAQELNNILPQAVSIGKQNSDTWMIDYSKLTPVLAKAIQELKTQLEDAKDRIAALEA